MTVATYAFAQLLRVLPRTRITRAVGRLSDARLHPVLSRAVVNLYVKAYRVAVEEAVELDVPYDSFDAFFTRSLRDGMRPPCTDAEAVVSPADGKMESAGPIHAGGHMKIKGRDYRLEELIGDPGDVARYEGGQFCVVYLSPRDYHRVHAPVAGVIPLVRSLPGDLYPVNQIGEMHVPKLFSINRRVAIVIDTPKSGRVTVVMVGAMIVGRITVTAVAGRDVPLGMHAIQPPRPVARGEEIGMFHLGSTAVVFVEKGVAPSWSSISRAIRLGEPLAERADPVEPVKPARSSHAGNGDPLR